MLSIPLFFKANVKHPFVDLASININEINAIIEMDENYLTFQLNVESTFKLIGLQLI